MPQSLDTTAPSEDGLNAYLDQQMAEQGMRKSHPADTLNDYLDHLDSLPPPPEAPKARTWGQAAADTGRSLASGVGSVVEGLGTLYGMSPVGKMDNGARELGASVQQYWEEGQSPQLKAKKAARSQAMDDADGVIGKAGTALWETISDPALAVDAVANSAAGFIPGIGLGRLGLLAKASRGLAAASKYGPASLAAREAVSKAAGAVGTRTAIGVGAVQQGADVSGDVYEAAMKKPDAVWANNPEFMEAFGATDGSEQAWQDTKHAFALSTARATMPAATAISLGANMLPGADMLERALVGGAAKETLKAGTKFATAKAIGKGALGEMGQEGIEEGGGAFVGNVAKRQIIDGRQDLTENVGENAGMGMAGGLLMGGAGGAFHGQSVDPAIALAEKVARDKANAITAAHTAAQAPNSPLSRATAAAHPLGVAPALTPEQIEAEIARLEAEPEIEPNPEPTLSTQSPVATTLGANEAPPVAPDTAEDPLAETQRLIDESLLQDAEDKASQRADEAAASVEPYLSRQQNETGNSVAASTPVAPELAALGVLDGDKTSASGKPFTSEGAAKVMLRRHPGHALAKIDSGWVIRPAPAQPPTLSTTTEEATAYVPQPENTGTQTLEALGTQGAAQEPITPVTQVPQAQAATELVADLPEPSRGRAASQAWVNEGKTPAQLIEERAADIGQQLAYQIEAEAQEGDFDAAELNRAIGQWADDGKVPADSVRLSVLQGVDASSLTAKTKKKIRDALNPAKAAAASAIDQAAHEAATSPHNDTPEPTVPQQEAGNYKKGHVKVAGMDIAIENPKGSTRSGVSPDGTEWSNTMGGHYGYFKGTTGNDGDHVDTYVGPHDASNQVFVIDQVNPDGSFDEHKIMIGYNSPEQAREAYMSSFMPGWNGLGAMTELPMPAFKSWLYDGKKKQPLGTLPAKAAPAPDTTSTGQAPTAGRYQLPEGDIHGDWLKGQSPDFTPTPRQQVIMDAVGQAKDEGLFYTTEVKARVAELLQVAPEVLAQNKSQVEGGDVGYDTYYASKAVDAQRGHQRSRDIARELNLQVGDVIGTLVTNDYKQTTGVTIVSLSDDGLVTNITGKRGAYTLTAEMGVDSIKNAIDRAKEKGKRKDGYAEFVASRNDQKSPAATENVAPAATPIRPAGWDKKYDLARPIAEAMGIALNDAAGVRKSRPVLIAEIKARDAAGPASANPQSTSRQEHIDSALKQGGKVVDGTLRTSNGRYRLTADELAGVPADKQGASAAITERVQSVYETKEDAAPVATTPTSEEAQHSANAELKQPTTLDEFYGNVDAGYRAHFDYAGKDGMTVWIEKSGNDWVLKTQDDGSTSISTKGGAGLSRWGKSMAMDKAEQLAKFRFTEWKPEAAAIEAKPAGSRLEQRIRSDVAKKAADAAAPMANVVQAAKDSGKLQVFTVGDLPKAPAPAAPAVKSDELADKERAAKTKMLNAAAKLADLLSKNTRMNITPEQEQAMLPIVIELFDGAMELGYVKFKQAARYVREFLANAIDQEAADAIPIDTLQGAYIATARRHQDKAVTPKSEVVTIDSIADLAEDEQGIEQSGKNADTGAPKDDNATPKLDSPSARPLENAPASPLQGAVPDGATENGADAGGRADTDGTGKPDGAGLQVPGSLGNGARAVSVPGRGTGRKRGSAQQPGVPGDAGLQPGLGFSDAAGGTGGLIPVNPAPNAAPIPAPAFTPQDFTIEDDFALGEGGAKAKFKGNVEAVRMLAQLDAEERAATPAEQAVLARYVGWGGLAQAFDADNKDWGKEYAELKRVMSEDDYADARVSTRYAHYTSRQVIQDGIYAALQHMGFNGGRALEGGAGVGNFIGLMPEGMRSASRFTAIEREPFSAKIAKHLYPQQNVQEADFTEFVGNDDFYDVAVGNPPFAADAQVDRSGRKHLSGLSLHNYFFAKAVDMLREGGILAQVVTNSFLDAGTDTARTYISDKTRFLGAIRLPNNAFSKNAGTEVTTDLIFLQKRPESEWGGKAAKADAKRWLGVGKYDDATGATVPLNQYFIDNPDMMLGKFGAYGTMYRGGSSALVANAGQDTAALLKAAVSRLPAAVYTDKAITNTEAMQDALIKALSNPQVQEGGYFEEDGKLFQRIRDVAGEARGKEVTPLTQWTEKTKLGDAGFARIQALSGMRGTLRALLAAELSNDAKMDGLRQTLNTQYDAYAKAHGLINDPGTLRVFDDDPDFPLLASLEHGYTPAIGASAAKTLGIKPVPSSAKKGPIFTRRVIDARQQVATVDTPADALAVSMAERGKLDTAYIGELLGRDSDEVLQELSGGDKPLLFKDPATNEYVLRDAYLSGNVRAKLVQAKQSGMFNNILALERVQPEDVGSHEIVARIGSPWVPVSVYEDFAKVLLGEGTDASVHYVKATAGFSAYVKAGSDTANTNTWGIADFPATAILSSLLNNKPVKVTWTDKEGTHTDVEATERANAKAQDMRQKFQDWLFADGDRAEVLGRAYNDTNNNYVTRQYDGSWMTFPGKVPDAIRKPRRHQRNAIARIVQDRTALLDHVVGAGKTDVVIMAAMELRRTGLARKPMIAVPNHLVKQWSADFYKLYPGANILTATKKDFEKTNRRKFLAKIATGDWDAVIIAHSSFGFIKPSPEFEHQFNNKQIASIMSTIREVEAGDGDKQQKKRTVKQLEGIKERLENRIKALRDKPMDALLDFGELGVDQLFVDEFHTFKNLMYSTKMQNVAGLGDAKGSQRAYDMYVKINQVFAKNGRGQGFVAATGTPVSNSLAEMYHMMRYLMPAQMEEMGFQSFDAWANTYASVDQVWMQKASGDGFKAQNRMSNFVNTPELLKVFDQVSDTVTMDDIKAAYREENDGAEFPLPKLKGGKRTPVSLRKSKAQESYMDSIAQRALVVENRKGPPEKGADNILVIMSDARKAAMDVRLVDPNVTEREPGGRIDRASQEIFARYQQYDAEKGTQIVFSDLGTPLKTAKKELAEYQAFKDRIEAGAGAEVMQRAALGDEAAQDKVDDAEDAQAELEAKGRDWLDAMQAAERGFSVYDDLKAALMEKGITEKEIAFIHDYNTDEQKAGLFRKMNAGQVRVLVGSTPKLGAGTNVQARLVALHHLDVPWKPSDVEQREGRIIRQGNELDASIPGFEVEVLAYVTQDTLDMRMWQVQETKLKMINQLRTRNIGREVENAFEDLELSAGEMQAAATGNIDLLREIQIKGELKKLEQRKRAFDAQKSDLQNRKKSVAQKLDALPAKIAKSAILASGTDEYQVALDQVAAAFSMTIDGQTYTDAKEAGKVLLAHIDAHVYMQRQANGKYGGPQIKSQAEVADAYEKNPDDKENNTWDKRPVPLSVEMNGTVYTSREKLAEAGSNARGDKEPIVWNFDGQQLVRRSLIESAIRSAVAEAVAEKSIQEVGSIGPFAVSVEGQTGRQGTNDIEVVLSYKGQTLSNSIWAEGNSTASVIRVAENLALSARQQHAYEQRQLAQAEKEKAELDTVQAAGEWPEQGKLEELREKHKEVLRRLSGAGVTVTADGETVYGDMGTPSAAGIADDTDVVFSRATPRAASLPLKQVQAIVSAIESRWENSPRIVVAQDMNDAAIPERVRGYNEQQKSLGATGEPDGFLYGGTVYLLADQLATPADVVRVLFHEVTGHVGLRGTFGQGLKQVLNQVVLARRADVTAKAVQYGLDPSKPADMLHAAEEVLAEMAQSQPELGIVRRAIAAIRAWLRDNVPGFEKLALTDDMLVQQFILPARRFVEGGGPGPKGGQPMPAFSRGTVDADLEPGNFPRAKDTVDGMIVRDDIPNQTSIGAELDDYTILPGVREVPFSAFTQMGDLRYYSVSEEKRTKQLAERIKESGEINPLIVIIDKEGPYVLEGGHRFDALREIGKTSFPALVVLDDDSLDGADIRFSRTPANTSPRATLGAYTKVATDKLNEVFSHPGKLSLWDRFIGSQYHLAERNPTYKRVFNAAQDFINDVSFYANEAANLAPKILPRMESWRDLAKSPVSAADNKAIAAPLLEGTLNWARDESGKPVRMDDLEARHARLDDEAKAQMLLKNRLVTEGQLKRWKGSPLDIYAGAVRNRFAAAFQVPGVVWTDAELKSMFKLDESQVTLYREFRAATDKSLDNLAKADLLRFGGKDIADLRDMVMEAKDADAAAVLLRNYLLSMAGADLSRKVELTDTANGMIDRTDKVNKLKARGYTPLSRFGRYTVDVVVGGERQYFSLFETMADANKMAAQMREEFGQDAVAQGTLSQKEFEQFQGITPESLELFGNMLGLDSTGGEAQDKAFQTYLKLTKTNRSAMRRMIHRQGTDGYSDEMGRVLAAFVYANARQTSAALHMGELGESVNDIPKGEGELKDHAIRLSSYIKQPQEEAHALRALMFAQYLGGSIASALVNFSQPFTVSFPYLSQFGGAAKSGQALIQAMKDQREGVTLDAALAKALHQAVVDGIVSPQGVHELQAQAQGRAALRSGDGTRKGDAIAMAQNGLSKLALGWGKLFGFAEQINRRSTFIAAYRVAVAHKPVLQQELASATGDKRANVQRRLAEIADPKAFAYKAVNDTQFISNKANKARFARGPIGATLMTFKSFSISYLELLHRLSTQSGPEGKRAAALMLATLFLMAGASGMPGGDDLEDLADFFAQRLGYNWSSQQAKQQFLDDVFGQTMGNFIDKGITGLPGSPLDVSARMGMGNLIPGTGLLLQKRDHTGDLKEVLGPVGDLIQRGFTAADQVLSGELVKAALTVAPKAVGNAAQGISMGTSDMYLDRKGYKVIDTTPGEAVLKGIGFQPATVARVQQANFTNQKSKDFYSMKSQEINARWAKGVFDKDSSQIEVARGMIADWNERNPSQRMNANMPAIVKRVKQMRMAKDERIAATAPKALKAQFRKDLAEAQAERASQ